MKQHRWRRKLLIGLATIIVVWLASPIPEGAIILGLLGFAGGYMIDWRLAILTGCVGSAAGSLVMWRFHLLGRVKKWAGEMSKSEC